LEQARLVVGKIEWHFGELFPRYYFIVTNSRLPAGKVVKVYNGHNNIENRIKEGKNTLCWDKTICHRFAANKVRLKMDFLAYNLLHLIRRFYLWGEEKHRSIKWIIMRLVKQEPGSPIMRDTGMSIWLQLFRWRIIPGLFLGGKTEVPCL